MSDFTCEVMRVDDVIKHPDADRLTIVKVRGYNCIANLKEDGSYRYNKGDLVVYIPEGAVLTEPLLKKMGFWKDDKGMLAGSKGNRVKAIKLRGIVSQGILYPVTKIGGATVTLSDDSNDGFKSLDVVEGDNVAEFLDIVKYEPVIPESMTGELFNVGSENTVKFDVENIQKYPDLFKDGEEVVFTEKLHGTFCAFAFVPGLNHADAVDGDFFAFSKGLGAQGLVFKNSDKNALSNIYHKALLKYLPALKRFVDFGTDNEQKLPTYVLGELYGRGIQDLTYDGLEEVKFRFFSVVQKDHGRVVFMPPQFLAHVEDFFEAVPVLYRGPFSHMAVDQYKGGKTFLGGVNIREGIVITPWVERTTDEIGRLALKAISPEYLLRKGGTEFN